MYENDYMYAIERSPEYLAHYGIRGMTWGVRKAIERGNGKALSRQYAKSQKKLAKLEKQASKVNKYKKRAIRYGAGAAAAGGLAALGTNGVVNVMGGVTRGTQGLGKALMNVRGSNKVAHTLRNAGVALNRTASAGGGMTNAMGSAAGSIRNWGNSTSIAKGAAKKYGDIIGKGVAGNSAYAQKMASDLARGKASKAIGGVTNNTIARIGAGAVGAGLAAASAKNAYRAATAQKRAARFKSEMNKAFAGTKYANGGQPRQGKKRRRG